MPKEVRQAHTEETVSASGAHRWCVSVLSVLKFTSFTFLSAISLPETPDYVHSPPPQQEVNIRTERTQEVVYSLAEMPWPFSEASEFPPGFLIVCAMLALQWRFSDEEASGLRGRDRSWGCENLVNGERFLLKQGIISGWKDMKFPFERVSVNIGVFVKCFISILSPRYWFRHVHVRVNCRWH